MADTTPEKLAREQAELERRGVERVRARNANVLDRLATAIKQASNLWELHHALCDFEKEYEDIHGRDSPGPVSQSVIVFIAADPCVADPSFCAFPPNGHTRRARGAARP